MAIFIISLTLFTISLVSFLVLLFDNPKAYTEQTEGIVSDKRIEIRDTQDTRTYLVSVIVTYEISEIKYWTSRYYFYSSKIGDTDFYKFYRTDNLSDAEAVASKTLRKRVRIQYKPNHPALAYVEIGSRWKIAASASLVVVCILVILFQFVNFLMRLSK